MVVKLNVILKDLKEHDSTLFQSNGLALKLGEKFVHSLNVKQVKCEEAKSGRTWKHQNITREVMITYSRAYTNSASTKEGKKKTAYS